MFTVLFHTSWFSRKKYPSREFLSSASFTFPQDVLYSCFKPKNNNFFTKKKIKIKKIINCKFQDNCVYVNWKNWVICRIRPNNYIMCERLGNFWCLHQYLYSSKRLRCFTSDYRVRMFSFSRAAAIVWAMGKTKLKMKHRKHLLSVCCTVR